MSKPLGASTPRHRRPNVLGAYQTFLDPQCAVMTNRDDAPCDRLIRSRVGLTRLLQGFNFAKPRLNGVIFVRFGICPISTVIGRCQFFFTCDQRILFGQQVSIRFDILRICDYAIASGCQSEHLVDQSDLTLDAWFHVIDVAVFDFPNRFDPAERRFCRTE